MPTFNTPTGFNFGPGFITPSAGDVEEARIKRLIDLARLAQMQQEPKVQQEQLNLQRQRMALESMGLGETRRSNVAKETHADVSLKEQIKQNAVDNMLKQMGFDVATRGQDVQQRGQDMDFQQTNIREAGATERTKLASEGELTRTLANLLGNDVTGTATKNPVLAHLLAERGAPELLKVLGTTQPTGTGDPVADATLEYIKNRKAGVKPKDETPKSSTSLSDILKGLFLLPGTY